MSLLIDTKTTPVAIREVSDDQAPKVAAALIEARHSFCAEPEPQGWSFWINQSEAFILDAAIKDAS